MTIDILKYLYRKPQHWFMHTMSRLSSKPLIIKDLNRVAIISPHPDDEIFGCGELMKELKARDKEVLLIYLSKGEYISKTSKLSKTEVIDGRMDLTYRALKTIGMSSRDVFHLNFVDGDFKSTSSEEIDRVREKIESWNPDSIFFPHYIDGSPDHEIASKWLKEMTDGMRNIRRYYYCVWIWHHTPLVKVAQLNYRESFYLTVRGDEKLEAINIYANGKAPNGEYYSGKLPKLFLDAQKWKNELFFKV